MYSPLMMMAEASPPPPHFTCFTSTKVQMLTHCLYQAAVSTERVAEAVETLAPLVPSTSFFRLQVLNSCQFLYFCGDSRAPRPFRLLLPPSGTQFVFFFLILY